MIPTSSAFRHGCKLTKAYFGVVALEDSAAATPVYDSTDYANRTIVAIAIHVTV